MTLKGVCDCCRRSRGCSLLLIVLWTEEQYHYLREPRRRRSGFRRTHLIKQPLSMIRKLECSVTLFWLFAESLGLVYWFGWNRVKFTLGELVPRVDDEEEEERRFRHTMCHIKRIWRLLAFNAFGQVDFGQRNFVSGGTGEIVGPPPPSN